MKTTTVDTSGGNSHLREVAEESGVDYMEYHSSEKTETIEGHKVESWYDEGGCKWCAFIMGAGTGTHWQSREGAVAEIMNRARRSK